MTKINGADNDSTIDLYQLSFHIPGVSNFLGIYELFKNNALKNSYTGKIGEEYPSPYVRYIVLKPTEEINATIYFGPLASLLGPFFFKNNKKEAQSLYDEALLKNDPFESIPLLEAAAKKRHLDAIHLLGIYYRDGIGVEKNPQKALAHFREAEFLGSQWAKLQLGILYLSGLSEGDKSIAQDTYKALEYYNQSTAPFAKYRAELIKLLHEIGLKKIDVLTLIHHSKGRFDEDFGDRDLAIELAAAFKANGCQAEAIKLLTLATSYLPDGSVKAHAFYQLAHCSGVWDDYQHAASLGHIDAAFELAQLKRAASTQIENRDEKEQLLLHAFELLAYLPTSAIEENVNIAMFLAHLYLGLGSKTPQIDKAIACYNICLNSITFEKDKPFIYLLIDFASALQKLQSHQLTMVLTDFKKDNQIWDHLIPHEIFQLPLLVGDLLLEPLPEEAKRFYELCLRQGDKELKATVNYALSQIEAKANRITSQIKYLEECIDCDPNQDKARIALYQVHTDRNKADAYLQPAINKGLADAYYVKGLELYKEAQRLYEAKQRNFTLGTGQTKENTRDNIFKKAKEFLVPAAKKGNQEAIQLCQIEKWPFLGKI